SLEKLGRWPVQEGPCRKHKPADILWRNGSAKIAPAIDWIDNDNRAVKALDHVRVIIYAGYYLPLLPVRRCAQGFFKRSVLVHQYFRDVAAKARSRDF